MQSEAKKQELLYASLNQLCKRDPLMYGITNIDLLEGRSWETTTRMWQNDIYKAVNPSDIQKNPELPREMVVIKPTQVGLSTASLIKLFHFADYWSVRLGYTLPRQQDVSDFVGTRVEPMIEKSNRLRELKGKPDSTRVKRIGDSYLFFMELSVEPRMMPLDAVYVDEVDLSNPIFMENVINRLDKSAWQLKYYFSTPTMSNFGIHALYQMSDSREWFVKCPSCGEWQVLDWHQSLKLRGPELSPTDVWYGCIKCDHRFTAEEIQQGRWVAAYPERSGKMIGFHVSQMMTHEPAWLYSKFIDPKSTLIEFYRKRLGMPYEIGSGSLDRDDFLMYAFSRDGDYFGFEDGYTSVKNDDVDYFMGVDQGNELQVVIYKKRRSENFGRIVHIELIPFEDGFSKLEKLMYRFKITRCVVDADPNRHSAHEFQKKFDGRVFLADYSDRIKRPWQMERNEKEPGHVIIHRTEGFDNLMESILAGSWQLPGIPPMLDQRVEKLIAHVSSLRRDINKQRGTSGEEEVVVYRNLGPDHLAHALLFSMIAGEMVQGKTFRSRKIKSAKEDDKKSQGVGETGNKNKRKILRIR